MAPSVPSRARAKWAALALVAWLVIVGVAIPALIKVAYEGTGPALLNDLISGQATLTVEDYLAAWWSIAWRLTIGVIGVGVAIAVAAPWVRRLLAAGEPMDWRRLLAVGAWCGLAAGFMEAIAVYLHPLLRGFPAWEYSDQALWMSPLANVAAFVGIALCLGLFTRLIPQLNRDSIIFPVIFFVAWDVFLTTGFPVLTALPRRLLALGITVQTTRLALTHSRTASGPVRTSGAVMIAAVAVVFAVQVGGGRAWETYRTSRLSEAPASAPNVLVLILDTVRAASMGLYGSARNTTPHIDSLAEESIVFDLAFSTSTWTLPSHGSVMTGRWHYEMEANVFTALSEAYPTVAEVMQSEGYRTGAFFGNIFYGDRYFGLDRGFIHYEVDPLSLSVLAGNARLTRLLGEFVRRWTGDEQLPVRKTATEINESFLRWTRRGGDRPYFALINYFDAHDPYIPPEPWGRTFAREGAIASAGPGAKHTQQEMSDLLDTYESSIAYLDHEIGALLAALRASGGLDNTAIILLSDHGEEFGEHGAWGHGNNLYTQASHVPLLVRPVGGVRKSPRVPHPVSIRDVGQTVFDLADVDPTAHFPGKSLLSERGPPGIEGGDAAVLVELFLGRLFDGGVVSQPLRSVILGDLHFMIGGDGTREAYDLVADPLEQSDLLASIEAQEQLVRELARARASLDSILAEPVRVEVGPGFGDEGAP